MKTSLMVILLCSLFLSCERNPCKDLKNGVYQYPELPENHTMTSDEDANESVFNLTAFIGLASQQIIDQIHEMAVEYFKTL